MSKTLILFLALSPAAWAQTPALESADARALLGELRSAHAPELGPVAPAFQRTERDCATFVFREDAPALSQPVTLVSREYREECHYGPRGERWCREVPHWTERRQVRVEVAGRGKMLPWERDVFEVCLYGRWLSASVVDGSHEYAIDADGWGGLVRARALRKARSKPDFAGLMAERFAYDDSSKNFVLELRDRWPEHYQGERVGLSFELKRQRDNWFDETVLKKELSLPTAAAYTLKLADFIGELSGTLKSGKDYYLKWRFRRLGQVSSDKWVPERETEKAAYRGPTLEPKAGPSEGLISAKAMNGDLVARACWIKAVEEGRCVYACRDGSTYRTPMPEGGTGVKSCPQVVIPFDAQPFSALAKKGERGRRQPPAEREPRDGGPDDREDDGEDRRDRDGSGPDDVPPEFPDRGGSDDGGI